MPRLLLINTDLEIGGTPTVVRELALRLRDWIEVEVVSLKSIGPIGRQLEDHRVRVSALNARSRLDLVRAKHALTEMIQTRCYTTVCSFLVHGNVLAMLARRRCPDVSRWIQSIQTTQSHPRWHWWLQRIAARHADLIVVPSASVARMATENCKVPGERVVVIPNAIDVEQFARSRHTVFGSGTQHILFVGRLDPIKRIDVLIESMSLLPDSFVLDIWGEGSERHRLESLVSKKGLSNRTNFHGATTDLHAVYRMADVLVLPSDAEGFGLVLIEAMAAGVPVVATDVPGICDVVEDQQTGLLVPPRDPRALAQAITQLAQNPSIRDRMIEAGSIHARENFSWDRILESYRQIIV